MKLQMTEVKNHDFKAGEGICFFSTGRVENGWWWESDKIKNSEGTFRTREDAIKNAEEEISARTIRNEF